MREVPSVPAEAPPSNPTVLLSLDPQPASSCAGPATAARSWWSLASESCGQRCKQVGKEGQRGVSRVLRGTYTDRGQGNIREVGSSP